MGKKKVQDLEVNVSGLSEFRKGTDVGAGKGKTLAGSIPSKESRNPSPYPNKHKVVKSEYHGIDVTVEADDRAYKRFRDEE